MPYSMAKIANKNSYTLQELTRYRAIAAKVVALYGDTYLPVFEHMHRMVIEHQQKEDMYIRALSLAKKSCPD
jgi:hypothetical protein